MRRTFLLAACALSLLVWGVRDITKDPRQRTTRPAPTAARESGPVVPALFRMMGYPSADARYRIWGYDVLTLPGEEIELAAKVEHLGVRFVHPDVKGHDVSFMRADEQPLRNPRPWDDLIIWLGTTDARTREEGIARVAYQTDRGTDTCVPVVVFSGVDSQHTRAALNVFTLAPESPIVLCDIDNTICRTEGIDLDLDDYAPIPGAIEGLTRIAARALVVYLTARDDAYTNRTRAWLEKHDLPLGPVFFWDIGDDTPLHHGTFKRRELARLKGRFPNLVAGFGNRPLDAEAYRANGIEPFLIGESGGAVEGYRTVAWDEAAEGAIAALDRAAERSARSRAAPAR